MRLFIVLVAMLAPFAADASIIVTRDDRVIDTICTRRDGGEQIGEGYAVPDPPGGDWSATVTVCGLGFAHMDSLIEPHFLGATLWAQAGEDPDVGERASVEFRLEFEVTAPSPAEWMDADGFRVVDLFPDTTYRITRTLGVASVSAGRVEAAVFVHLIPEPGTLALLALGFGALGLPSLLPKRRPFLTHVP